MKTTFRAQGVNPIFLQPHTGGSMRNRFVGLDWHRLASGARLTVGASLALVVLPFSVVYPQAARTAKYRRLAVGATYQHRADIAGAQCNPAVTLGDLSGVLEFNSAVYTTQEALQFKLPFVSSSGSGNQMILVRDLSRAVPCQSADGSAELVFGQTVRTIITVDNWDANVGSDYVAAAANATLKHSSSKVNISVLGYDNPKFLTIIGTIAGKDLNVETLPAYRSVMEQLVTTVGETATQQSVKLLGESLTDLGGGEMADAPAIVFGLASIADGKSCKETEAKVPNSLKGSINRIDLVYTKLLGNCTDAVPGNSTKSAAVQALRGIQVKL